MPARTPRTKSEKQAAVHEVMHEFRHGTLRSGSKSGPKVKSREQAVAIAMSESGQSRSSAMSRKPKHASQPHPRTNPGDYDTGAHGKGANRMGTGRGSQEVSKLKTDTYSTEAHSTGHHGTAGRAVGQRPEQKPMTYPSKTNEEGRQGGAVPTFVPTHDHGTTNKAQHHPRAGDPHTFNRSPAQGAQGFGHPAHLRSGSLRNSGHSGAHRIGKR